MKNYSLSRALFSSFHHELMLCPNIILFTIQILFFSTLQSHVPFEPNSIVLLGNNKMKLCFWATSRDTALARHNFGWFLWKASGIWTCSWGSTLPRYRKSFGFSLRGWIAPINQLVTQKFLLPAVIEVPVVPSYHCGITEKWEGLLT